MNGSIVWMIFLIVCSSCTFQYNELSSNIKGTEKEPFTIENDTLQLRYSFNRGLEEIEIFNKSKKPLYVDWSRSSLIIDGNTNPYWADESAIGVPMARYNSYLHRVRSNAAKGITKSIGRISFIPPNSRVKNIPFDLRRTISVARKQKIGERSKYTEDSSPVKLRSFIMLSFDENFAGPIVLDYNFWISEAMKTSTYFQYKQRQNIFTLPKN